MQKSTTSESAIKRIMADSVKSAGGFARRIEDQYGVGILDLVLIPRNLPAFFAEVKIVRGNSFAPSDRQFVELMRIQNASELVVPLLIGWKEGVYYFHKPAEIVQCQDCFSVTTSDISFNGQLVQYYWSQKK